MIFIRVEAVLILVDTANVSVGAVLAIVELSISRVDGCIVVV